MKFVTVIALTIYIVTAKPLHEKDARITEYQHVNDGVGNYNYAFSTSNGIIHHQIGELKQIDDKKPPVNVLRGYFFFIAPDNTTHEVHYLSDEFGYRAQVISPSNQLNNYRNTIFDYPKGRSSQESKVTETTPIPDEQPTVIPETTNSILTESKENEVRKNANKKNVESELEFPDRIGTPAIISLQGPPGK